MNPATFDDFYFFLAIKGYFLCLKNYEIKFLCNIGINKLRKYKSVIQKFFEMLTGSLSSISMIKTPKYKIFFTLYFIEC